MNENYFLCDLLEIVQKIKTKITELKTELKILDSNSTEYTYLFLRLESLGNVYKKLIYTRVKNEFGELSDSIEIVEKLL